MSRSDDVTVVATEDLDAVHAIRRAVFVEEQDIAEAVEFDDRDDAARHFLARVAGEPAGTARVRLLDETTAKVERVAVLPEYRTRAVGRTVMEAAHDYARDEDRTRAVLHAQTRVREFYESLGYESVGEVADESGIPHVEMVRDL